MEDQWFLLMIQKKKKKKKKKLGKFGIFQQENLVLVKTWFNENHIKWSSGTTLFLIQIQIHANKSWFEI